jgi:hypothetical protein
MPPWRARAKTDIWTRLGSNPVAALLDCSSESGRKRLILLRWKDGRVVEGTGLENRQGVTLPRGFESHSFRQNHCSPAFAELHHCPLCI